MARVCVTCGQLKPYNRFAREGGRGPGRKYLDECMGCRSVPADQERLQREISKRMVLKAAKQIRKQRARYRKNVKRQVARERKQRRLGHLTEKELLEIANAEIEE